MTSENCSEMKSESTGANSKVPLLFLLKKGFFLLYIICMKIVVMSDSHGRNNLIDKVLFREQDADFFLHCGDLCSDSRNYPDILFVEGNCDWDPELPPYRVVDCGRLHIFMIHGDHLWNLKSELARMAKNKNCSICVFGHIHRYYDQTYDGVRLLNPGSLSHNRDENEEGYIVLEIDENGLYTVERKVL